MVRLSHCRATTVKKRLLVTELWGLGDLAIGSPFLAEASLHYDILLLAKPYALDLGKELWPDVQVEPFVAPWTSFHGKYRLHQWPWHSVAGMLKAIRKFRPDIALSARWDPRDHVVLALSGAKQRIGFPRSGSQWFLTDPLPRVNEDAPRFAQWEAIKKHLQLPPSPTGSQKLPPSINKTAVIHTGAAQPVRVWPLERYASLAADLASKGFEVIIVADQSQQDTWTSLGNQVTIPSNPKELVESIKQGSVFIGNDSGPGHIAAALGKPTYTIFGPQRPEWFLPNHPRAGWTEGKPCPHKPCFDYCRFPKPHCLLDVRAEEVIAGVQKWLEQFSRQ